MTLETITKQIANLKQQIPAQVQLLAVSKTQPVEIIEQAIIAGHKIFGENYLQEGQAKIIALNDKYQDLEWHFIGHLQSNKAKHAVTYFSWIDSVDSIKLAQELNKHASALAKRINILIQVKVSAQDANKFGVYPNQVLELTDYITQHCSHLTIRGLQIIEDPNQNVAEQFSTVKNLFDSLQFKYGKQIDTLSMGMSNSLSLAVEYGSTMVRIGTALFGTRK